MVDDPLPDRIVDRLQRCGVATMPTGTSGSEAYMNQTHGLGRDQIAQKARDLLTP